MKALLLVAGTALGSAIASGQTAAPAPLAIAQDTGRAAAGYVFYTQQAGSSLSGNGPVIVDNAGRAVWYQPLASGIAADFRVQAYQGKPVLTWAQGESFQNVDPGTGVDYICDDSYNVIATVRAGNGLNSDLHEFELTPQGTALITIYHEVPKDLSRVGGASNGVVIEGAVQEIDVASGRVLFEWHSLAEVDVSESYAAVPVSAGSRFDYFHINSVKLDTDGNLLISARHTWTVYKVNRATGAIMWRLGGKRSDFALGPGLPFSWQHNAVAVDASTIRLFDNGSNGAPSRVLWIRRDEAAKTATIVRSLQHPAGISSWAEGSAQGLPNGNTIVGWGSAGGFSEFDDAGNLVFDARQPQGDDNYRTYRFAWVGHPATRPEARATLETDGSVVVHAIWNGATAVDHWAILGGNDDAPLSPLTSTPWGGLDTAATVAGPLNRVQVVAYDAAGAALATSDVFAGPFPPTPPSISHDPTARNIVEGGSVVFRIIADHATDYQWYRNGQPLADDHDGGASITGAKSPTLLLRRVTAAQAGRYTCTASNSGNSSTSAAAILVVVPNLPPSRLVNVSCRATVGAADQTLIVGFVTSGSAGDDKSMLIRAAGPALARYNIVQPLGDPRLELYAAGAAIQPIAVNSDWAGNATVRAAAEAVNAFPWPDPASRDAAILKSLPAGGYTAVVSPDGAGSGVALAEVYDVVPAVSSPTPRLTNISGRAPVGTGENALIVGFIIAGSTGKTVLIRAAGPALRRFGVSDTLDDPQLELYRANGTLVAANTGWEGDAVVAAAADEVGAFPWTDAAAADSALLLTLAPGAYSVRVSGASADTGIALAEVYEIP